MTSFETEQQSSSFSDREDHEEGHGQSGAIVNTSLHTKVSVTYVFMNFHCSTQF